jgi:hypothetical protein
MQPLVKETILERLALYKEKHDSHLKPREFAVGDFIRLRQPDIEHELGQQKKLRSNWTGPWLVMQRIGENVVKIQHCNNPADVQSVNVERIAPYYLRKEDSDQHQQQQQGEDADVPDVDADPPHLEEEEEEVTDPTEYDVERIVKERDSTTQPGHKEYYLKWKGYRPSDNTWVIDSDLHADELLQAWRLRKQSQSHAPKAKSVGTKNRNSHSKRKSPKKSPPKH